MIPIAMATSHLHTSHIWHSSDVNYPQILPLSKKEKIRLDLTNALIAVVTAALWSKFLVDMPEYTLAIGRRWTQVQDSTIETALFLILLIVCFFILVTTIWVTYLLLKNRFTDRKAGIKHAGVAEVISKQVEYGSDGSDAYFNLTLRWTPGSSPNTVEIEHHDLYVKVSQGNRLYLEMLPNSKKLLSYQIL